MTTTGGVSIRSRLFSTRLSISPVSIVSARSCSRHVSAMAVANFWRISGCSTMTKRHGWVPCGDGAQPAASIARSTIAMSMASGRKDRTDALPCSKSSSARTLSRFKKHHPRTWEVRSRRLEHPILWHPDQRRILT